MPRYLNKSNNQIKAILFDLDETLIDAVKGLKAAHTSVSRRLHAFLKNVTIDEILREMTKLDDDMNRLRRYDRDLWWQMLINRLGFHTRLP
ncbi:MAG: hypothetical protein QXH91_07095, partial [Candidatus Bathyarchaeia archaeon]